MDQVFAGNQTLGGLFGYGVILVAAVAQQLARQQTGIRLQSHTLRVQLWRLQAREIGLRTAQQRHPSMQHEGYRRIHPFHGRAGTRRAVGGAVRELGADRAGVAESGERIADVAARQAGVMVHAALPVQRPA